MAEQKLQQSFAEVQADLNKIESTPEFTSVGDGLAIVNKSLVASGLQTEITAENPLSSDLISDDGEENKFVTAAEKQRWDGKQDHLTAGEGISIINGVISATIVMPSLMAPMVSKEGNILQITDNTPTSGFVTNYLIYANSAVVASTPTKSFDLSQISLIPGAYAIGAVGCASGFLNSPLSNTVSYNIYGIDVTVGHGQHSGDATIAEGQTATITVTAATGYDLPDSITVIGAQYTYNKSTGVITLSQPDRNITISVECDTEVYSIATNISNGTYSGATSVEYGKTATVTLTPNTGYALPSSIAVSGAEYIYSPDTGTVVLSNASNNISIVAECSIITYAINTNITSGTHSGPTSINYNSGGTIILTATSPNKLPDEITVNGVTGVSGSVGATWSYNKATGEVVLVNVLADISITAVCPLPIFTITASVINGNKTGDTSVTYGDDAYVEIVPNSGYNTPTSVSVVGATYSYASETGIVTLTNVTDNVTISATCPAIVYAITGNISYGTMSGDTGISIGETASITITPSANYKLPNTIGVVNATLDSYSSTTGAAVISNPTGNITINATCAPIVYTIITSITHGSYAGEATINAGGTAIVTVVADPGYNLPTEIAVNGATYIYNQSNGQITLSAPTGDVSISVVCAAEVYTITGAITHGTLSGESTISYGGTAVATITPNNNYRLPQSITIANATLQSYSSTAGTVVVTNPTGNVTITAVCSLITYNIATSVQNGSYSGPSTINAGGTATITLTPSSGYRLPESVAVSGASYEYSKNAGTVVLSNPTTNVAISVVCEVDIPTLETPTVTLSGDTLSMVDNDGNTEQFEIYVDGTKVVTVPKSS